MPRRDSIDPTATLFEIEVQAGEPFAAGPPPSSLPSWLDTPLARTKDPETSQFSAHWIRVSSTLAKQEKLVYRALLKHPGLTSQELAQHLPFPDRYIASRRLAGLADRGVVRRGAKWLCGVTGQACLTWYIAGSATRLVRVPEPAKGTVTPASAKQPIAPLSADRVTTPAERRLINEQMAQRNPAIKRFVEDVAKRRGGRP